MGYNHFIAEKHFKEEWSKLIKQYEEVGMSQEIIHEIYQYDREVFNSDRRYMEHTVKVEFEGQVTFLEESVHRHRLAWIDEIADEKLAEAISQMKYEDLDMLTMLVFEGYKGKEIAELKGVSPQAISKKIKKLKKFLENF